jgi:hypothetical protein
MRVFDFLSEPNYLLKQFELPYPIELFKGTLIDACLVSSSGGHRALCGTCRHL